MLLCCLTAWESPRAIRGHLAALERNRLVVQSGTRRDTGGKPTRLAETPAPATDIRLTQASGHMRLRGCAACAELGRHVIREVHFASRWRLNAVLACGRKAY